MTGWLKWELGAVMMLGGETGEKLLRRGGLLIGGKECQDVIWIPQKIKHQK